MCWNVTKFGDKQNVDIKIPSSTQILGYTQIAFAYDTSTCRLKEHIPVIESFNCMKIFVLHRTKLPVTLTDNIPPYSVAIRSRYLQSWFCSRIWCLRIRGPRLCWDIVKPPHLLHLVVLRPVKENIYPFRQVLGNLPETSFRYSLHLPIQATGMGVLVLQIQSGAVITPGCSPIHHIDR